MACSLWILETLSAKEAYLAKTGYLYPEELERLRTAYIEMMDRKSDYSGSAFGEHYAIVALLKQFGITDIFEASSQVENYVEHLITCNQKPTVY